MTQYINEFLYLRMTIKKDTEEEIVSKVVSN
jgi:hypothetical protein